MPICKLCLKDKSLSKKSHIIPEFMYKELFDEKHKYHEFSPQNFMDGDDKMRSKPTGEYESEILCQECDRTVINDRYENYANRALYGGHLPPSQRIEVKNGKNQNGLGLSACSSIEYSRFKLFLLSILWRASISSRPFFSEVNLGSAHNERLRKMILDSDPGAVHLYPVAFFTYVHDKSIGTDMIVQPRTHKMSTGHRTVVFMITGMIYFFYVNAVDHRAPAHVISETIKPNGSLSIFHIPQDKTWQYILGLCGVKIQ